MVMRTTLTLSDDAIDIARRLARHKRMSLGEAVSELVRRGAQVPVATTERQGLAVVRLPKDSERVSAAAIEDLLEEQP
jgi:diphthamide biosynthesis methyltransferase